ncbi:sugar ABC transporter permease [Ktedonosporobacter rubrisoli]|uniref:Sugar ABC transporter permease n=2 Tax=Ktedonosporobacter rubrisoli TaxID=2509675 RepID=A0A4P6K5Y6_KTERU|nr:sugar ABC transporter permease [Ktedonosporobacter rubrisoli]
MSMLKSASRALARTSSRSSAAPRSSRLTLKQKEGLTAYLSLLPAILLVAILVWYPLTTAIYHSFTLWDGENAVWVGLKNYVTIFSSGDLWLLLRTNLIFFLSIPGILLIAMMVSILLFDRIPGWRFFRSVYYIPTILSTVVIGYLMNTLFNAEGAVNAFLKMVGLGGWAQSWFDAAPTAFLVLILAFYWQTLGQGVLVFLAGLSAISNELLEAARIDGANWWQRLFRILFPLLAPSISYFMITNTIYIFIGLFALVYSITHGGPGYETTPIDYMIYLKAFETGDLSYASALSVILLLVVSVISWIQIRALDMLGAD